MYRKTSKTLCKTISYPPLSSNSFVSFFSPRLHPLLMRLSAANLRFAKTFPSSRYLRLQQFPAVSAPDSRTDPPRHTRRRTNPIHRPSPAGAGRVAAGRVERPIAHRYRKYLLEIRDGLPSWWIAARETGETGRLAAGAFSVGDGENSRIGASREVRWVRFVLDACSRDDSGTCVRIGISASSNSARR
ncbi:hypothetical protein BDV95DRAFT_288864 [Massariosphaeria phaeospora]|uniref:Uncharacterized protein n=1 Tax=Massariosphaeria phaeospora TaxID=100035 RepID=A0A7C8MDX0_9PLEO|nr:hypothetical protein BDV95DRAFT_288864 [Massariosphaeria phaeospora]